jgi:hypothetical protein
LSYDSLPPGSDIRHERSDATLRITIPAADPPPQVLKQTAYDALASGAMSSWGLLLLACVVFYLGIRANRISGIVLTWAWAFFAIFCAAIVMLVSWVRYGMLSDALRIGRRQMTVLVATRERLLIETTGPFGAAGYDLPRDNIVRLRSDRGALRDQRGNLHRLSRLAIVLRDHRTIHFLPARDPREIRWVIAALQEALFLPPPSVPP